MTRWRNTRHRHTHSHFMLGIALIECKQRISPGYRNTAQTLIGARHTFGHSHGCFELFVGFETTTWGAQQNEGMGRADDGDDTVTRIRRRTRNANSTDTPRALDVPEHRAKQLNNHAKSKCQPRTTLKHSRLMDDRSTMRQHTQNTEPLPLTRTRAQSLTIICAPRRIQRGSKASATVAARRDISIVVVTFSALCSVEAFSW